MTMISNEAYVDWKEKKGKLIIDKNENGENIFTFCNMNSTYVRHNEYCIPSLHFLDIGIMGSCKYNCSYCYMKNKHTQDMSFETFKKIINDNPNLFQISLGGAGNPIDHPEVANMIKYAKNKNMLVNTTVNMSSKSFSSKEKFDILNKFDGIGISYPHSDIKLIKQFMKKYFHYINGTPRITLHVILGITPLEEICQFLQEINNINNVLFLANKTDKIFKNIHEHDKFIDFILTNYESINIGIDSCLAKFIDFKKFENTINNLYNNNPNYKNIYNFYNKMALEKCDGAKYSAYISPDGKYHICSILCDKNGYNSYDELYEKYLYKDEFCKDKFKDKSYENEIYKHQSLIIKHGFMTNSSSASYFIFSKTDENIKIPKINIENINIENNIFYKYFNDKQKKLTIVNCNKMAIKIDIDNWASYVSLVCSQYKNQIEFFSLLTQQIINNDLIPYYYVCQRETEDFDIQKICENDQTIYLKAGEEH